MAVKLYTAKHCTPCHAAIDALAKQGNTIDGEEVRIVDVETDEGFKEFEEEVLSKLPDGGEIGGVDLPFCWDGWKGELKLTRTFFLPDSFRNRSCRLVVERFAEYIAVKLNNAHLDTRRGDGLSFQLALNPGQLHFGSVQNEIELTLDNRLSRKGTVITSTVIHVAPSDFTMEAPYAMALIETPEGARLMLQVADCEPGDVQPGMELNFEFRKIRKEGSSGILCYGFKGVPA